MAKIGEFDFIEKFLKTQAREGQSFFDHPQALGIGDDAALIPPLAPYEQLAVSTDMLVEGRHYFAGVDPRTLGHKVLAVNLSDLAAMGARPIAFTLAAALRSIDEIWLKKFLEGMFALSRQAQCALIGGDTTGLPAADAPQVFSVTVMGAVPVGRALRRDGLSVGDDLWVSGSLGDASRAVAMRIAHEKLNRPQPRLALGRQLLGLASAAIDISDGLTAELHHLVAASSLVAGPLKTRMDWDAVPLGPDLAGDVHAGRISEDDARLRAVTGGDEYELLFAAASSVRERIDAIGREIGLSLVRIGEVVQASVESIESPVGWRRTDGRSLDAAIQARLIHGGFTHF